MIASGTIMGIDVSKEALDLWSYPEDRAWRCGYTDHELYVQLQPSRVFEATGTGKIWMSAAVVVVNPRQVRQFNRASGRLAKTDRLDALLAHFGNAMRPPVRSLPDAALRELRDLVSRRRQLIAMQTQERNRRRQASHRIAEQIQQHVDLLATQIDQLAGSALLNDNVHWRARATLLRTIPGVGPALTASLIAQLPELGQATHKEIASLAGVAPFNRDRRHAG